MRVSRQLSLIVAAALGTSALSSQALAQQATPPDEGAASGEILVTATRRNDSIQKVPLSITVLTGETLRQRAATSFFDFASGVPNLSFGNAGEGTTGSRSISIRGIADSNTTGFYIDETPLPDSLDPRIVDVERIEVLRGPQGTLFGARSQGGTVRLITTQPSTTAFSGRFHGSISTTRNTNRPNFTIDGAINVPLVKEVVGVRIVPLYEQNVGYFTREFGPTSGPTTTLRNIARAQTDGVSVSALIKPTDRLTFTPRFLYQATRFNGFPFADIAVPNNTEPTTLTVTSLNQRRNFDVPESSRDIWKLLTGDIRYDAGFGTFSSSTSYFIRDSSDIEDQTDFIASPAAFGIDPIATSIELDNRRRSFTQEFRFVSSFKGPIQFVAGLFYNSTVSRRIYPANIIPGLDAATGGALGTDLLFQLDLRVLEKDYAAYAEGSWEVLPGLKAVVGARVFGVETTSESTSDGIVAGGPSSIPLSTQKESGVQPKFSLQYQATPDINVYATAAQGYRPGGVNGLVPPTAACQADLAQLGRAVGSTNTFRSDSVWSYEAGAKTTLLDRKVTFNVAGFYIDWSNIQQRIQLACGFGFRSNAGKARSQGFEIEITARPVQGLALNGGFGLTDAKFTESFAGTRFTAGDRLPQVARYTLNAGFDYRTKVFADSNAFLNGNLRYVSSSTSAINSVTDADGRLVPRIRPAYTIIDFRTGLTFKQSELALFAKNITDERANLSDGLSIAAETPGRARATVSQPRTFGVEYRYSF